MAPVYFATSEQFGIDGMLTRVTRLPRDDRWDALARGALRDDLYAVLESLTRRSSRPATPGQTAAERIAQWAKTNAESLTRARTALSGIERIENPRHRGPVGGPAHAAWRHPQRGRHDMTVAFRTARSAACTPRAVADSTPGARSCRR